MRNTHPNLYKTYMTFAVASISSGLNFIFLTPAFMPLSTDKWLIGLIFLGPGIVKLMLLLFGVNHLWLRTAMAVTVGIYTFWSMLLTYDFFDRSLTSLQLPIFVITLAILGFWWLVEPMVNPATEKNGNGK